MNGDSHDLHAAKNKHGNADCISVSIDDDDRSRIMQIKKRRAGSLVLKYSR
jgi:hypothetical protein